MNVSSTAVKYAEALADVAAETGSADRVSEDLTRIQEALSSHAELAEALANPSIPFRAKRSIIERVGAVEDFSPATINFWLVLLENGRLALFDEMVTAYQMVLDRRAGIIAISILSARPLDTKRQQQLGDVLREVAGGRIRCQFEVDSNLLGGVKLQIGSKVFDGTVRTRLEEIRSAISGAR